MSIKDKTKWNKKYKEIPSLLENRDPSEKLINILSHVQGKKVLDVACGSGKNSIYLAKQGFDVEALDISEVALEILNQKNISGITTQCLDLEGFTPKKNNYDLIVKTNYLDRAIINNLTSALKQNGILFIETYMNHEINEKPNSNPDFLLKENELKGFVNDSFEIIFYEEFNNEDYELHKMRKQAIAIKKL